VHDYRKQIIKDIPSFGNNVIIHFNKRRYRCSCGKRFAEKNPFLLLLLTDLQKAVTIKSRFLKEMHTVIIILTVFVIVSYICFLIKNHTYTNKRQLNAIACFTSVLFGLPQLLT
ncbi:MAG TPA: transposase family protein, partial [Clostridiales bacterium]|nr:transposase family protein [Clostridiales bacterium]